LTFPIIPVIWGMNMYKKSGTVEKIIKKTNNIKSKTEKMEIEEMASIIAHEIKNPLSLVKANVELLELADEENAYSKNYFVIKNELDKINDMMMDFLHLTKNSPAEKDIIYLRDIIQPIFENYKITLSEKIKFEFNCEDEDIAVLGSENSLKRVVANVIKNAVEAIDDLNGIDKINEISKTGGKIIIDLYCENEFVVLDVTDNGAGISVDFMNEIEKPFFTTKPNGNGLGVSITKKIIEEFCGYFTLENNRTKGCIAKIKIPTAFTD